MTGQPPEDDPLARAKTELLATITAARTALDRRRATPVHTPDERAQLQEDARNGLLGRQMQELAERIERGEDSWPEVFEGTSPHTELFHEHLARMVEEHGEEIRQAVEEDEDFDPMAPDPEV